MTATEPEMDLENEGRARRDALDDVVVNELARGRTYEEAASRVGWSSRTVARRMRDPQFRRRVSDLRSAWVSELSGRLVDSGSTAIEVIVEECQTAEKSADRLRAAGMLLTIGLRLRDAYELEERLQVVEERLGLADSDERGHGDDATGPGSPEPDGRER